MKPLDAEKLDRNTQQEGASVGDPHATVAGGGVRDDDNLNTVCNFPAVPLAPLEPDVSLPGYEILSRLGYGSMGVVYKARQLRLDRLVAVKMILSGPHARQQDHLRFFAEAQAIARLRHPHIVQIYDFGQHEGRPYFTMEYLEGGNLADRLAGKPFAAREAATLVAALARALHAAHQSNIVHRDLKPANVLLTQDGYPKVTDFGLAKQGDSGFTASRDILGTPAYMAPEQARGKGHPVGPAADVYALGSVLYECLTGRPPFNAVTPLETMRQVLDQEAVPPRKLSDTVPRDLEVICLKCLRKEQDKRYVSAQDLADDLDRFLAGRPILAKPVGTLERTRMWVRRNPVVAGLLAAVVLVAATGVAGVVTQYQRAVAERDEALTQKGIAVQQTQLAHRAEDRAKQAAEEAKAKARLAKEAEDRAKRSADLAQIRAKQAEETTAFLEGLFQSADPTSFLGYGFRKQADEAVAAAALLERGAKEIEADLAEQPAVQARLLNMIGRVYRSMGKFSQAREFLEKARGLQLALPAPDALEVASNLCHLGWLEHDRGDYVAAERLLLEAVALQRNQAGPRAELDLALSLLVLGWTLTDQHNPAAGEYVREALRLRRAHLPPEHRDIAVAKLVLAAHLLEQRQWFDALPLLLAARQFFVSQKSGEQIEKGLTAFQWGVIYNALGRREEAQHSLRESLAAGERFLGPLHPLLALVHGELAVVQEDAGDLAGAERSFQDCLNVCRNTVGLGHPRAVEGVRIYADLLKRQQRFDEADAVYREALENCAVNYGQRHVNNVYPLLCYADLLLSRNRLDEAAARVDEAVQCIGQGTRLHNPNAALALGNLGESLHFRRRFPEAEAALACSIEQLRHHPEFRQDLCINLICRSRCLRMMDQIAAAESVCATAWEVTKTGRGLPAGIRACVLGESAHVDAALDRSESAELRFNQALELWMASPRSLPALQYDCVSGLAALLARRAEYPQAAEVLQLGCRLLRQQGPSAEASLANRLRQLAACQAAAAPKYAVDAQVGRECLALLSKREDAVSRGNLLFACAISKDSALAARALQQARDEDGTARAALLVRANRTEAALAAFDTADSVQEVLYKSLAQAAAGRLDDARKTLEVVETWLDSNSASSQRTRREGLRWDVRIEVEVLLRQARAAVERQPPDVSANAHTEPIDAP